MTTTTADGVKKTEEEEEEREGAKDEYREPRYHLAVPRGVPTSKFVFILFGDGRKEGPFLRSEPGIVMDLVSCHVCAWP